MSGGQFAVKLTPLGERPTLDPSTAVEDRLAPTEVHIGGREIVQAFVVAFLIVVVDEGCHAGL